MHFRPLAFCTLLSLAAAFIPADRNITCPGDEGQQFQDPKSNKTYTIECDVSHNEGNITSARPRSDTMNVCVGGCARLSGCVLVEWDSKTGLCALKSAYGVPTRSEGTWVARLDAGAVGKESATPTTEAPRSSSSLTSTADPDDAEATAEPSG